MRIIDSITAQLVTDMVDDVVTGFGILNEPFKDCDISTVKQFNEDAYEIIKNNMKPDTTIFVGDMFNASRFASDHYWKESPKYDNTLLDSHYYHVFDDELRGFSPKQHIAFVCGKNFRDAVSCCGGGDGGVRRIVGEFSAAFDTLVSTKLEDVMESYRQPGQPILEHDRVLNAERRSFLRNFVEAQMVAFEGGSLPPNQNPMRGWFFWNFKMEGGAFAEWDMLRGVREGWIPAFRHKEPSVDRFGTCRDIFERTDNDMSIVHEFPDPSSIDKSAKNWQAFRANDDLVLHSGASSHLGFLPNHGGEGDVDVQKKITENDFSHFGLIALAIAFLFLFLFAFFTKKRCDRTALKRFNYSSI